MSAGIEFTVRPQRSRRADRLVALAFVAAVVGLGLLSLLVARRGTPLAQGAGLAFALSGAAWVAHAWARWRRRPVPHELAFRADGKVEVRGARRRPPIECVPDRVLLGQRTLALTLRPVAGSADAGPVHWLSGDDAVADDDWRRIRAWLVWRGRGPSPTR